MTSIPLGLQHLDILGEARRDLSLSDSTLATQAGLTANDPAASPANAKITVPLSLGADARVATANQSCHPRRSRQLTAVCGCRITNAPFQRDQILFRKIQNKRSGLLNLGLLAFRVSTVS